MNVGRKGFMPMLMLAAVSVVGLSSKAHGLTVVNSSFESPVTGSYTDDGNGAINNPSNAGFWGWGYYFADTTDDHDSGVQTNGNAGINFTSDGNQNGWVNGNGNYLYQDVGALAPNTTYKLTVAVAAPGANNYAGFGGTGNAAAAETDVLALLNGNNSLVGKTSASAQATGLDSQGVATTADILNSVSVTPNAGGFTDYSVSYTTGASVTGDLTLILEQTAAGAHEQGDFDNVRLAATSVPEPASIGVLAVGSLLALRRRSVR